MRCRACLLSLLALCAFTGAALAMPLSVDKFERATIDGQAYVRLRDYAAANACGFNWVTPMKSVRVASGSMTLTFSHDSKLVTVNGVNIWLSYPAVIRDQKFYVSLVDLKTLVAPLLSPPKGKTRVTLVALDAGHGGRDRGYFLGTRFEKTYTLLLAQEVKAQLAKLGIKSFLVRTADEYMELSDRPARAQARKADVFVSLHFNSGGEGNREAQGLETYVMTPVGARSTNAQGAGGNAGASPGNLWNDQSLMLAYLTQRAMLRSLGMEDRGVRRARFEVLREATMPAILVEGGFLSHPREGKRIADPVFRRTMAKSIAEAIVAYKKIVER